MRRAKIGTCGSSHPAGGSMSTLRIPTEQRFLLSGVAWDEYLHILRTIHGRNVRITYDRGDLELMTLSPKHEWLASLFGRLLETLTIELGFPIRSAGATTFKRRKKLRGL